jgi:hypothetical protein
MLILPLPSDEFDAANRRGSRIQTRFGVAKAVRFDKRQKLLFVQLDSGVEFAFSPRLARGLEVAKLSDLEVVEITPSGLGLYFPTIDADVYLPALPSSISNRQNGDRCGPERA